MGYKTTSAERTQATSAISSAIAAFNNPDGSGFALTSTALTEGVGLKQYTIIPGTNPVNSETSIGGAVITAVAITDSNYTVLDDTALATTGGYIKLTGTGFKTGCIVYVGGVAATTTTFVSSTEVRAAIGSNSSNTFTVSLANPDGSAGFYMAGIAVSGVPAWSTSATLTAAYEQAAYTQALSATGDATISYALKAGSNLPSGVSLNSVTGALTGTTPADTGSTTYTFTIIAIDGQNQDTERLFSLTINTDTVTWASPADGTSYELPADTIMSNVALQATSASGRAVTYAANTLPTGVTLSGNVISGTATVVGQAVSTLLTANNSVRSATRVVNWTVIVAADPYFNNTVLLLNTTATNGAQNNTFLDSSTNNYSITRSGNATQGTFSPFSQTGWSNYFNGTTDFLSLTTTAALTLGTNSFTVEYFYYVPDTVGGQGRISWGAAGSPNIYLGTGALVTYTNFATSVLLTSSIACQVNAWNHIAIVRNSGTTTIYINGVSGGSVADTRNWSIGSGTFRVMSSQGNDYSSGYVSNLRIVNGSAVYTSNFTPPTSPLTAITNTVLLTCQDNRFRDNSANNFTVTPNGSTSVQAFSPFAPTAAYDTAVVGGSAYFDGSGDYLLNTTNGLNVNSGTNFTFECWLYRQSTFTGDQGTCFFAIGTEASNRIQFAMFGSAIRIEVYAGTLDFNGGFVPLNAWTHVAIVRSGTTITIYINGVSATSATWNNSVGNSGGFIVGANRSVSNYVNGYISGLRFLIGTALYTTNFSPPTTPPTAISNTYLLLNFTNAGAYDATAKNVLQTIGGVRLSTAQYKYGNSSIEFDGTGDRLHVVPNTSTNVILGTGDFTIELWVYFNTLPSGDLLLVGGDTNAAYLIATSSGAIRFGTYNVNWLIGPGGTMSTGVWNHVAVSRSETTINLFLNGTAVVSSVSSSQNFSAASYVIGGDQVGGTNALNGYIDDVRITKGYARYTATFTPPTEAFKLK